MYLLLPNKFLNNQIILIFLIFSKQCQNFNLSRKYPSCIWSFQSPLQWARWVSSVGSMRARWVNSILSSMSKLDLRARWVWWKLDGGELDEWAWWEFDELDCGLMVAQWVIWTDHVRRVFWEFMKKLALFQKKKLIMPGLCSNKQYYLA